MVFEIELKALVYYILCCILYNCNIDIELNWNTHIFNVHSETRPTEHFCKNTKFSIIIVFFYIGCHVMRKSNFNTFMTHTKESIMLFWSGSISFVFLYPFSWSICKRWVINIWHNLIIFLVEWSCVTNANCPTFYFSNIKKNRFLFRKYFISCPGNKKKLLLWQLIIYQW